MTESERNQKEGLYKDFDSHVKKKIPESKTSVFIFHPKTETMAQIRGERYEIFACRGKIRAPNAGCSAEQELHDGCTMAYHQYDSVSCTLRKFRKTSAFIKESPCWSK